MNMQIEVVLYVPPASIYTESHSPLDTQTSLSPLETTSAVRTWHARDELCSALCCVATCCDEAVRLQCGYSGVPAADRAPALHWRQRAVSVEIVHDQADLLKQGCLPGHSVCRPGLHRESMG